MSFALDMRAFVEHAKANADQVVRKVATDMLASIVTRSPVGNPDLWKANHDSVTYNNAVDTYNDALRQIPENVNSRGHLKRGRKLNDSMDLATGKGYVGGRFRGNWQVTFNQPAVGETGVIDKEGGKTKSVGNAVISAYNETAQSIWMTNNVPYATRLEYGHSKQAPNGMVRITAAEFQQIVNQAVQELAK